MVSAYSKPKNTEYNKLPKKEQIRFVLIIMPTERNREQEREKKNVGNCQFRGSNKTYTSTHTHTHEQAQCMIHVEKRNSEQKNGQIVGKHAANISNKSFANM